MNRLEDMIKEQYDYVDIDASLPACRLYAKLGYQTVDHGIWECKNGVIQVYEIMKKQFEKRQMEQLKLRPYKPQDAAAIVSWIKDERALRKWSSDRYGKRMMQMAIRYAVEMLKAEKITLGVFENNPSAYYCYKAAGFRETQMGQDFVYEIHGEKWKCIEMEINK